MDTILTGVLEVAGVNAAVVADGEGGLVAYRGRAVFDRGVCEQLAVRLARVLDAVQLQQEDWDALSADYTDGKLLVRNLGTVGGRSFALGVVADSTLNPTFATVAIRVAANKLRRALAGVPAGSSVLAVSQPGVGAAVTRPGVPVATESAVLANTGVSWSRGSSVGLSRVAAADPASAAFLTRCARELARHVGPMAKVYVEEAVRRVAGDQPFAMANGPRLLEDLAGQIEDPDDRAQFRRSIQKG